jgi:hypothetical protein
MQSFYIIIENGDPYPTAYKSYAAAVNAVKDKHCECLFDKIKELGSLEDIESTLADVNPPENTETNKTYLYIEKGIHIYIHRFNTT